MRGNNLFLRVNILKMLCRFYRIFCPSLSETGSGQIVPVFCVIMGWIGLYIHALTSAIFIVLVPFVRVLLTQVHCDIIFSSGCQARL